MESLTKTTERKTADGHPISASHAKRLERDVKGLKLEHDTLRIKILTMHGAEKDLAKEKTDKTRLEALKKMIRDKETSIIEIRLALK